MAKIKINTNGLQKNISDMQEYISQLSNLNGRLYNLIREIRGSWEGDSCDSYISTMESRLSKSREMEKVLENFKKYMYDAKKRFEDRDKSGASRILYTAGGGGYSYGSGGAGSSGGGYSGGR